MTNHTPNTFVFSDDNVTSLGYVSVSGQFYPFAKGPETAASAKRNDNRRLHTNVEATKHLNAGLFVEIAASELMSNLKPGTYDRVVIVQWADGVNSFERVVGVVPDTRKPSLGDPDWFPGKYVNVVTQQPGCRNVHVIWTRADRQYKVAA